MQRAIQKATKSTLIREKTLKKTINLRNPPAKERGPRKFKIQGLIVTERSRKQTQTHIVRLKRPQIEIKARQIEEGQQQRKPTEVKTETGDTGVRTVGAVARAIVDTGTEAIVWTADKAIGAEKT